MIEIATLSYVPAVGELGKWIDDSPVNPGGYINSFCRLASADACPSAEDFSFPLQ